MVETDDIVIFEMLEDLETPCDYSSWYPHDDAAEWIAHCGHEDCGEVGQRLICTSCKDTVISTKSAVLCPGCAGIISPARLAYKRFEAL